MKIGHSDHAVEMAMIGMHLVIFHHRLHFIRHIPSKRRESGWR